MRRNLYFIFLILPILLVSSCTKKKQMTLTVSSCRGGSVTGYLNKGWKIVSTNSNRVLCGTNWVATYDGRGTMVQQPYYGTETLYILEK